MYTLIAGTLLGAWLVGRGRPRAKVLKREVVGSQSGVSYQCEEFPEAGLLMLSRDRQCKVILERRPEGGFTIRRAEGTPEALTAARRDFMPQEKP